MSISLDIEQIVLYLFGMSQTITEEIMPLAKAEDRGDKTGAKPMASERNRRLSIPEGMRPNRWGARRTRRPNAGGAVRAICPGRIPKV
jgi:hypothetical protein